MGTTAKKSVAKDSTVKKATPKKAAAKKVTTKKTASKKKTAVRKAGAKNTSTKKAAAKKAAAKKTTAKRVTVKKPVSGQDEVGGISEENLRAMAADIDRQMKMLAEVNTRVLIAKDQLADFQENISSKIKAFKEKNAGKQTENLKDIMASVRNTKDEAAKMIKDSKALNDTYELVSERFEKGRVTAAKEIKKAEAVFLEKLHEVEARVVKKAGEIKKNLKK